MAISPVASVSAAGALAGTSLYDIRPPAPPRNQPPPLIGMEALLAASAVAAAAGNNASGAGTAGSGGSGGSGGNAAGYGGFHAIA